MFVNQVHLEPDETCGRARCSGRAHDLSAGETNNAPRASNCPLPPSSAGPSLPGYLKPTSLPCRFTTW